jgi:hypothetical protein
MSSFRRSQLRGSEELFRPTELRAAAAVAELVPDPPPRNSSAPAPAGKPDGHLVRLSEEEIAVLADAVQRLKFPNSTRPRPSVAEFEQLEELRQKLLSKR